MRILLVAPAGYEFTFRLGRKLILLQPGERLAVLPPEDKAKTEVAPPPEFRTPFD